LGVRLPLLPSLASLAGVSLPPGGARVRDPPRAAAHPPASGPCDKHCPTRLWARSGAPGNRERRIRTKVLEAWPRGKAAPCYGVGRFAASQVRVLLLPLFRRGRVGKTRDCYSRGAGSIPAAGAFEPPWSKGDDTGPSTRRCGFESRRGYPSGCRGVWPPRRFREPEIAGSTPASQT
jgi:hypothetical protein